MTHNCKVKHEWTGMNLSLCFRSFIPIHASKQFSLSYKYNFLFNLDLSKIFNCRFYKSICIMRSVIKNIYYIDKKERLRVKDESINFTWFILLRIRYEEKRVQM